MKDSHQRRKRDPQHREWSFAAGDTRRVRREGTGAEFGKRSRGKKR